jgi:hypothetical protein
MSTFPVLDVVIALVFLYLLFAMTCTAVNEAIASAFNRRGKMLRKAVDHLLGDPALASAVYRHPLVNSLGQPSVAGRPAPEAFPSYIPASRFATALTDHLSGGGGAVKDVAAVGKGIAALPPAASRQLKVLYELSNGDATEFHARVGEWYDQTMDRATGWYKRSVSRQTYVMAVLFVIVFNLDSVQLFNRLWSDSAFREAAVEQARARIVATGTAEVPVMEYTGGSDPTAGTPVLTGSVSLTDSEKQLLTSLSGWDEDRQRLRTARVVEGNTTGVTLGWILGAAVRHSIGWLVTIFAISLGAPFWFDLLNRIMNLRSAGKVPDPAPSKA